MSKAEPLTLKPTPASLITLIPPWLMVVIAILSLQVGAAAAKSLFDAVQPTGVVFLRTLVSAVAFGLLWRPKLTGLGRTAYTYAILYGVNNAFMMLSFYAAIDRIPLAITVAIAFVGPLAVAVAGSRRARDLLWVALAGVGIVLLSPLTNTNLDPVGVALAFLSALTWATYILLSARVNRVMDGSTALTLSMAVAALISFPIGIGGAIGVLGSPSLLVVGIVVGLMTMPPRVFGLLVSLEPVVATLIGLVILGEVLGARELAGIACVTIAATATARSAQ
jgi:inner membrane transporter RhtA